jgi:hypothetical protein
MRIASSLLLCVAAASPALAAEPVERRLYPAAVEASSFLWNDFNKFQENYHPNYLVDGDPKTAWVEGAKGAGAGEWVRLKLTPLEGATQVRLKLRNGYQKSPGLFRANARAKTVTVKVLPGGAAKQVALKDAEGWQDVTVAVPAQKVEAVELRVDEVYPGTKYEDLCLSDAQVFVTATTRDNPAFEKAKLDQIKKWKAERVAAAKAFKGEAAKSMPVAAQYKSETIDARPEGEWDVWAACEDGYARCLVEKGLERARARASARFHGALDRAIAAAKGEFAGFVPVQLAGSDKRTIPAVDGLCAAEIWWGLEGPYCSEGVWGAPMDGRLSLFRADTLGTLEVKDAPKPVQAMGADIPACKREQASTLAWARSEADASGKQTVRELLVVRCGLVESRDGMNPVAETQLLVYGDDGRLALTAGRAYVTTYAWRDADGRASVAGGESLYAWGDTYVRWQAFEPVAAR